MVEARSRFNDLGVIPLLPFDADFLGVRRRGVRLGVFLVDIVEGVFSKEFPAEIISQFGEKRKTGKNGSRCS